MEDINSFLNDDSLDLNSQSLGVKLERISDSVLDSLLSEPSVSSSSTPGIPSQNLEGSPLQGSPDLESAGNSSFVVTQKTASKIASTASLDDFEFKSPSSVGRSKRSTNPLRSSGPVSPAGAQSAKDVAASEKQNSLKKKPAVKIASFAKASSVDRLAPSTRNTDLKLSKRSLDDCLPNPHITSQGGAVGSKPNITQTSLPTPALNAALRSFFNYGGNSENNSSDAGQSDDEDEEEDDEDEEVEEEEILVYMQFDSKLDSDLLQPHTPFKIIGVDSEKPVLQLGNQVFEGNWTDTVGTAAFFEENISASPGDPVFMKNERLTLNYHSKTQKALIMSRIFVKPKEESDVDNVPMVPMAIVEVTPDNAD